MHKAERPCNYFFINSFTHNQVEQIKKGVSCVQLLLEIILNTVDFLFKVGHLHFHTRLGHSNVVFVL